MDRLRERFQGSGTSVQLLDEDRLADQYHLNSLRDREFVLELDVGQDGILSRSFECSVSAAAIFASSAVIVSVR